MPCSPVSGKRDLIPLLSDTEHQTGLAVDLDGNVFVERSTSQSSSVLVKSFGVKMNLLSSFSL